MINDGKTCLCFRRLAMAKKRSQKNCDVRKFVDKMTEPMTVDQIRAYTGYTRVSDAIQPILDRLIEEGSLKTEDNPNDFRSPLYKRIGKVDLSGC
jgi:hypothetical protein